MTPTARLPHDVRSLRLGARRRDADLDSDLAPSVPGAIESPARDNRTRVARDVAVASLLTAAGLPLDDLHATLAELLAGLNDALERLDVVDAFLLAAAVCQVVADHQEARLRLVRSAARVLGSGTPLRAAAARALRGTATSATRAASLGPRERRVPAFAEWAGAVTTELAGYVVSGDDLAEPSRLGAEVAAVRGGLTPHLPLALRTALARPPSCFRSFDQRPQDVVRLADELTAAALPGPVTVVGVRTSGSYLAPLLATALEQRLGTPVPWFTLRPEMPAGPGVAALEGTPGTVVVVDDPPDTGSAVLGVLGALERIGVTREHLAVALPLFTEDPPAALSGHRIVALPWRSWSFHDRLSTESVRGLLANLLEAPVTALEPLTPAVAAPPTRTANGHVARRFLARVPVSPEHPTGQLLVVAEGAGLGYLGRVEAEVARALAPRVPRVLGFADGVLVREWEPGQQASAGDLELARPLADYVEARIAALPLRQDRSHLLGGRQPVWEVAATVLSRQFGRAGVWLRPLVVDPVARALTRAPVPTLVDGDTGIGRWIVGPDRAVKLGAAGRVFSHLDLVSYDPAYDVAGVDPGGELGDAVRVELADRHGYSFDDERWLLYQLVHGWSRERVRGSDDPELVRAGSRAVHRYLAAAGRPVRRVLPDVVAPGAVCVVDIDGVLENDAMGFPAPTPGSVAALQALLAHGFEPVLATGRSLDEVRERCATWGLVGGVAEYGGVVLDARHDVVLDLVPRQDRALLDEVRARLAVTAGVGVVPSYRHSVRAWLRGGRHPRPLPDATVREVLAGVPGAADRLRVVRGARQTDLVAASVDKGRGVDALLRLLSDGAPVVVRVDPALAVGDTVEDLPMLRHARLARAPRHASAEVAAEVRRTRAAHQRGFAEAVGELLGHRPGSCPVCVPAARSPRARLLTTLLSAGEGGRRGLVRAAARSTASVRLVRRLR